MQKNFYDLSKFKRGDFYSLSNKIISKQIISQKDFSEFFMNEINFSNCEFYNISLNDSNCENLNFKNCSFYNVDFSKSELGDCYFIDCKFENVYFNRAVLADFAFVNSNFDCVLFDGSELSYVIFDRSWLKNVSFASTRLDNVKIKRSTLEKIKFDHAKTYEEIYENNILTVNDILLKNYVSFLTEVISIKSEKDNLKIIDQLIWDDKYDYFNILTQVLDNLNNSSVFKEKYMSTIKLAKELEVNSVFLKSNYQSQGFSNFVQIVNQLFELYERSEIRSNVLKYWIEKILLEMKNHYT